MDDAVADLLSDVALFAEVPRPAREQVIAGGTVRQLAPGERLLKMGQPNRSLFIVLEGAMDVHLSGADAPLVRLHTGECVGELSLIDGEPTSATVVAATASTVLEVGNDQVWALIDSSPVFARNFLRVLAGRVRNDDAALTASLDRRRHYERLSMQDSLTALHNRRWFDAVFPPHAERLLAEERAAALLMVDVDRFKDINDRHGHAVGDTVLRWVAQGLADALRPCDLLARYGGEEFAVLVADAPGVVAFEVAERLRESVEQSGTDRPTTRCTVSIGVALVHGGEPFAELVARADEALFRAKSAGRNRVSS
jgi:diguanylate cyclase (GGDEF)-like protein